MAIPKNVICGSLSFNHVFKIAFFLFFLSANFDICHGQEIIKVLLFEQKLTELQVNVQKGALLTSKTGRQESGANTFNIKIESNMITVNGRQYYNYVQLVPYDGSFNVNGSQYDGNVNIIAAREGGIVINEVPLEKYIAAVVSSEMPVKWPIEVLKAQAVAARTYALYQKNKRINNEYHLFSSVLSQAYNGKQRVKPSVVKAVSDTAGLILEYNGRPALTVYHSTSVGYTEAAKDVWFDNVPYLTSVLCPNDTESPHYEWGKKISLPEFEKKLRSAGHKVGSIATFTPFKWSDTGRVKMVRIIHSGGELFLSGEEARKIWGYKDLPSTKFRVKDISNEIELSGNGAGHGVGMCQFGAKKMADEGADYKEILSYYYPSLKLISIDKL